MKVLSFKELIENKELKNTPVILTIGVFDGFHLGHRALAKRMEQIKEKTVGAVSAIITFNTNPKTDKPKNVDSLRLREENASNEGIDYFVIIDFSSEFSKISARGFIELLVSSLSLVEVVVGEDFRFGCPSKSASALDLEELFLEKGANVKVYIEKSILTEGGEKISSTLVRKVIEKGEVGCISSLTGRNYRVDLMPVTYKFDSRALVISISSIQQILPPQGAYWAELVFFDSNSVRVCVVVGKTELTITGKDLENALCEDVLLDSIYFLERKNGIK